jgi:hypothetical protein
LIKTLAAIIDYHRWSQIIKDYHRLS